MVEIHCSALPRILSCNASAQPPASGNIIEGDEDNSATGRLVHAVMARYIRDGEWKPPTDDDRARILAYCARRQWDEIAPSLEVVAVETPMSMSWDDITLTGTPDVYAKMKDTGELVIVDWKTGVEKDVMPQLVGYLALALSREKEATGFKAIVAWCASDVLDVREVQAEADILALDDKIASAIAHPQNFRPSPSNCQYCPRRHECPAHSEQAIGLVKMFGNGEANGLPAVRMAELLPRVKQINAMCEQFEETFKTLVDAAPDGKLAVDGGHWERKPVQKREIDAAKALPVIVEKFGGIDAVAEAVDISTTQLIRVARSKATGGRGRKQEAEEALVTALDNAGAIVRKIEKKLTFVKEE